MSIDMLSRQRNNYLFILAIIIFLGLVIRIGVALNNGLYWDEWSSIRYARLSMGQFIDHFSLYESHPPLFFLIQKMMIRLFGENAIAIRLYPILAGASCIAAVAFFASSLFNRTTALCAAFVLAVHPFHILWSATARMYSPVALFAVLSSIFLPVSGRTKKIIPYIFFCVLMMYHHYYGSLIMLAHFLYFSTAFAKGEMSLRAFIRALLAQFAVAVVLLPWILSSNILPTHQNFKDCITTWLPYAGWSELRTSLLSLFMNFPSFQLPVIGVITILLMPIITALAIRRIKNRNGLKLILFLSFTPSIALMLISQITSFLFGSSVFQPLQTVIATPAVAILLGAALDLILNSFSSLSLHSFWFSKKTSAYQCSINLATIYVIAGFLLFSNLILSILTPVRPKMESILSSLKDHEAPVFVTPFPVLNMLQHKKNKGLQLLLPQEYYDKSTSVIYEYLNKRSKEQNDAWLAIRSQPQLEKQIENHDLTAIRWFQDNYQLVSEKILGSNMIWSLQYFRKKVPVNSKTSVSEPSESKAPTDKEEVSFMMRSNFIEYFFQLNPSIEIIAKLDDERGPFHELKTLREATKVIMKPSSDGEYDSDILIFRNDQLKPISAPMIYKEQIWSATLRNIEIDKSYYWRITWSFFGINILTESNNKLYALRLTSLSEKDSPPKTIEIKTKLFHNPFLKLLSAISGTLFMIITLFGIFKLYRAT